LNRSQNLNSELQAEIEHFQQLRPRAGEGVHRWVFEVALRTKHHSEEESAFIIRRASSGCGRSVDEQEIVNAVRGARRPRSGPPSPKWPPQNPDLIASAIKDGPSVGKLRELSPIKGETLTSGQILNLLFPGDDVLLCAGATENKFRTALKREFVNVATHLQFVVPNPMTSLYGQKKGGGKSQRCLDNTGPRRFLVVESDPRKWNKLTPEEQKHFEGEVHYIAAKKDEAAASLWDIARRAEDAPLVMVVDSGGKSLHGWFLVASVPQERIKDIFAYAVAVGADPMTWTPCQLVRMPNGTRDDGNRQSVVYFNPQPLEVK
jgi:hypothetical protein